MALSEKRLEWYTPWNGMGVKFITLKTCIYLYLALVLLKYGFGVAVAFVEDYLGRVENP